LTPFEQVVFLPMPRDDENVGYFKALVEATPGIHETLTDDRISASGPISSFTSIYPTAYPDPRSQAQPRHEPEQANTSVDE
jgi:hypothetical protein